jgi:hypothetical protein
VAPVAGLTFIGAEDIEEFVVFRVVGDIAGLQAIAGGGDEELAEGIVADDADDGVGARCGLFALGDDVEELLFIEKGLGGSAVVLELDGGGEGFFELVRLDGAFG